MSFLKDILKIWGHNSVESDVTNVAEVKRKRKSKEDVIRKGDCVKIIEPKFIKRVGYALIWTDFIDECYEDDDLNEIAHKIGCSSHAAYHAFMKAAAMGIVHQKNFGGDERKIIYDNSENLYGYFYDSYRVINKKIAKTGKRFPSYGYEDDWEPGGLENEKTHILIQLETGDWIEDIHVEKIKQEKK